MFTPLIVDALLKSAQNLKLFEIFRVNKTKAFQEKQAKPSRNII